MNCNLLALQIHSWCIASIELILGNLELCFSKLNFCWNPRMFKNQDHQPYFKTATLDLNLKWTEPHYFNGCFCFTLKIQKCKVKSLEPLAFKEIWQIQTDESLRIVYKLITCCCSESLAQVGSKYLDVNFHRPGFTILKRVFMKMLKRVRKNCHYLVLLHIFWCHVSILN